MELVLEERVSDDMCVLVSIMLWFVWRIPRRFSLECVAWLRDFDERLSLSTFGSNVFNAIRNFELKWKNYRILSTKLPHAQITADQYICKRQHPPSDSYTEQAAEQPRGEIVDFSHGGENDLRRARIPLGNGVA